MGSIFQIHRATLTNFRGIEHATIPLGLTTVLVGDNGSGKTCWLEGIGRIFEEFIGLIHGEFVQSLERDARQVIRELGGRPDLQVQSNISINVLLDFLEKECEWQIQEENKKTVLRLSMVETSKNLLDAISRHQSVQAPVFAYYSTRRFWPQDITPGKMSMQPGSRLDAYTDCFSPDLTHGHLLDWMRDLTLEQIQKGHPIEQLANIERAVVACVEGAEKFYFDIGYKALHLRFTDGTTLPFRHMSDGYRNIVSMVADIAWRASVLNPQLGAQAIEKAEGLVLIDEIDLHLHPKWQRRIVNDLRRTFPKLQMVMTTHSPFIIQSLQPGQLVNLDTLGTVETAPYADQSPEDIIEHVMGVELPQRSERRKKAVQAAEEYYVLLEQVPAASPEQLAGLRSRLDELLAPYSDNPAFVALLERKRRIAESTRQDRQG